MPNLFLDIDGVFADFDGHFQSLFGSAPPVFDQKYMWALIDKNHTQFWGGIPLKAGALDMWATFKVYSPTFLTGLPYTRYEGARRHKLEFVQRHFEGAPTITCFSRDKQKHMTGPGDVLLDDRKDNCARWNDAGGRAVFYTDPDQSIRDVLALMT